MKRVFAKFYNSYRQYSKLKPYKTEYATLSELKEKVGEIAEVMAASSKTIEDALKEDIGDALVILLNLAISCRITHEELLRAASKKLKGRSEAYAAKRDNNE